MKIIVCVKQVPDTSGKRRRESASENKVAEERFSSGSRSEKSRWNRARIRALDETVFSVSPGAFLFPAGRSEAGDRSPRVRAPLACG